MADQTRESEVRWEALVKAFRRANAALAARTKKEERIRADRTSAESDVRQGLEEGQGEIDELIERINPAAEDAEEVVKQLGLGSARDEVAPHISQQDGIPGEELRARLEACALASAEITNAAEELRRLEKREKERGRTLRCLGMLVLLAVAPLLCYGLCLLTSFLSSQSSGGQQTPEHIVQRPEITATARTHPPTVTPTPPPSNTPTQGPTSTPTRAIARQTEMITLIIGPYEPGSNEGDDPPTLHGLADGWEGAKEPGHQTWYVEIASNQAVRVGEGWCALNHSTLEQNWEQITWALETDGKRVDMDSLYFHEWDGADSACRGYYGIVRAWPSGRHTIVITLAVGEIIHDGWDPYPAGDYTDEFVITVR